jgi:hypothetical protein
MKRRLHSRPWLATLSVGAALALGTIGPGAAQAATGILPPTNPSADCDHSQNVTGDWGISNINSCRALEGVGAISLPSNWGSLTLTEQGFVLMNLERVNRGLPAIVGLSASLNHLAAAGAASGNDPAFPSGGFSGGGGIWGGASSVFGADYMWMYDDGAGGFDANVACTSPGASGCWMHRDIILWGHRGTLVAGGGVAGSPGDQSFAYLVLAGYSTANLTFTWAHELRYFATKPGLDPLGKGAAAWAKRHRHKHQKPKPKPTSTTTTTTSSSSSSGSNSGPSITIG